MRSFVIGFDFAVIAIALTTFYTNNSICKQIQRYKNVQERLPFAICHLSLDYSFICFICITNLPLHSPSIRILHRAVACYLCMRVERHFDNV